MPLKKKYFQLIIEKYTTYKNKNYSKAFFIYL